MERRIALGIVECLRRLSSPLNDLTEISKQMLSLEEAKEIRRKIAALMFGVDDILDPIVREFPELEDK